MVIRSPKLTFFPIKWRGNTTVPLSPRATAIEVKQALENLPVINFVNVNRSAPSWLNGYTWTIEFVSVNRNTSRGYELQDTENLEPIVPVNNLIATNASLTVQAHWLGINQTFRIYDIARQGTYGTGAGAVYIFQRRMEIWNQVATITGNDTAENSRFGHSVALNRDTLLVGSIGANLVNIVLILMLLQFFYFHIFKEWGSRETINLLFGILGLFSVDVSRMGYRSNKS